jgi:uncharacterized protein YhbP (UPF0306 family)
MTNNPDKKIYNFIDEHHVLSLATSSNGQAYMANCFFIFNKDNNEFIFTSSIETRHGKEMIENQKVAASIVLETKTIGKIQGLQITGTASKLEGELEKKAKKQYLLKYPYAILKAETMWSISVDFFKLTDNRLGFGKKIIWSKHK